MSHDLDDDLLHDLEPAPEAPMELVDRLRRYVTLSNRKKDLEKELREVQYNLSRVEEPLLEQMSAAGFKSVSVDGMTVYHQREFFARLKEGASKEQAVKALQDEGLVNCLMLSHQTLRALVKEMAESEEVLPDSVLKYVEVGELVKLRARKN